MSRSNQVLGVYVMTAIHMGIRSYLKKRPMVWDGHSVRPA